METNPLLIAIDNPAEAAYLAERRRGRRRQLLVVLACLGLILGVIGWKVGRHIAASVWLESNHHQVDWFGEDKKWMSGGVTSVKFIQTYGLTDNSRKESDLKYLTWLHRVEQLDLTTASGLTDDDLAVLDQLTSLRLLNLDRSRRAGWQEIEQTRLTDASLARMHSLKKLEELNLGGHAITDAGLAYLVGLDQLKNLELKDTLITDAALEHLKALPSLKILDVTGTKITAEAIRKFELARPEVNVSSGNDVTKPVLPFSPNR
jgi:hypothetical protein